MSVIQQLFSQDVQKRSFDVNVNLVYLLGTKFQFKMLELSSHSCSVYLMQVKSGPTEAQKFTISYVDPLLRMNQRDTQVLQVSAPLTLISLSL